MKTTSKLKDKKTLNVCHLSYPDGSHYSLPLITFLFRAKIKRFFYDWLSLRQAFSWTFSFPSYFCLKKVEKDLEIPCIEFSAPLISGLEPSGLKPSGSEPSGFTKTNTIYRMHT
jgi:hypothetical protein